MNRPKNYREKIPTIVTEGTTRNIIANATIFLKEHSAFFTNRRYYSDLYGGKKTAENSQEYDKIYDEANDLYYDLAISAKILLEQGGKVPPVLNEINRLLEKLELILGFRGFGFYTNYCTLSSTTLVQPWEDKDKIIKVKGWLVMASTNIKRDFGPNPLLGTTDYEKKLDQLAPFVESSPIAKNIAIHTVFSVDRSRFACADVDLGWELPDVTMGYARTEIAEEQKKTGEMKKALGVIWRIQQLSEKTREKARKTQLLEPDSGQLTLIAEERGEKRLRDCDIRPRFNNEKLDFGVIDMKDGREKPEIRTKMENAQEWLIERIIANLRRDTSKSLDNQSVIGGRAGISLVRL